MATKATSYRFTAETATRIEKLTERGGLNRTQVIEDAVYNLALQEGIVHEEAYERFAAMLERHGDDAVITFAVQPSEHVPVSINGKPTQEIRAHRFLVSAWYGDEVKLPDPEAEHRVLALIPKTPIAFDLGRVKPDKIEMKLTDLFQRMRPFQPRTAAARAFANELGRQVGLETDDE